LSPFSHVQQTLSLFSKKTLSTNCKVEHGYQTCSYKSASTTILSWVSFDYFDLDVGGTSLRALVSDNEDKIMIVLSVFLLY